MCKRQRRQINFPCILYVGNVKSVSEASGLDEKILNYVKQIFFILSGYRINSAGDVKNQVE